MPEDVDAAAAARSAPRRQQHQIAPRQGRGVHGRGQPRPCCVTRGGQKPSGGHSGLGMAGNLGQRRLQPRGISLDQCHCQTGIGGQPGQRRTCGPHHPQARQTRRGGRVERLHPAFRPAQMTQGRGLGRLRQILQRGGLQRQRRIPGQQQRRLQTVENPTGCRTCPGLGCQPGPRSADRGNPHARIAQPGRPIRATRRRRSGQAARQRQRRGHRCGIDHPVQQPQRQRLDRADRARAQHQPRRLFHPDQPGQTLGGAARRAQAQTGLGKGKPGSLRSHTTIAGQGQRRRRPRHQPGRQEHHRDRKICQRFGQGGQGTAQRHRLPRLRHRQGPPPQSRARRRSQHQRAMCVRAVHLGGFGEALRQRATKREVKTGVMRRVHRQHQNRGTALGSDRAQMQPFGQIGQAVAGICDRARLILAADCPALCHPAPRACLSQ